MPSPSRLRSLDLPTGPIPAALRDGDDSRRPATRHARQLPNYITHVDWDVVRVRRALEAFEEGQFAEAALLADWLLRDDRVSATLGTRVRALQGLPFRWEVPEGAPRPDVSAKVQKFLARYWKRIAPRSVQADILRWTALFGFCVTQLVWDTSGDVWVPTLEVWHPQYIFWRWDTRSLWAMTMDGPVEITPGDGQWAVFAPHGIERGWMQGALRPLAILALLRQYAVRDWGRASELYGLGVRLGYLPANCDPDDEDAFLEQLVNLGSESVLLLKRGDKEGEGFDFDLKALAGTFNGDLFEKLGARCDTGITLVLLGQNLTSEVQGGSLAAARVHGDVRQDYLEADAVGQSEDWHSQVLVVFVVYNVEGTDLEDVPLPLWDCTPPEDKDSASKVLVQFGQGLTALVAIGLGDALDVPAMAERFDVPLRPGVKFRLQSPAAAAPPAPGGLGLAALAVSGRQQADDVGDTQRDAVAAVRPDVRALLDACRSATSLQDMQMRLSEVARTLDPEQLADVAEQALLLASLHGRHAVLEGL